MMPSTMLRPLLLGLALYTLPIPSSIGQGAPPRDAQHASFWERVDHPPADGLFPEFDWYRPTTTLAGKPGTYLPTGAPGRTTVPAWALEAASQFAEASNSYALIVVHKGVVQLERYYQGRHADTRFSSHSFAKTLAALAIGTAIDEGHIASIDEPASKWIAEWRPANGSDPRKAITLRHLLTMSGGFRTPVSNDPADRYLWMHYGSDVEDIVSGAPLAYQPGTDWAFDNDNLQPLALVVERATGMPYERWVSTRIWQKIGASDATMLLDREGGRAMGYCCIVSTPRDWLRVGQMLADGGTWQGRRIVRSSFVDAMRTPSTANANFGLQVNVGAAWFDPRINRSLALQKDMLRPADAPGLWYLYGAGGQTIFIMPSEDLVVLRVGKPGIGWREQVLPNLIYGAVHRAGVANSEPTDWSWIYDWRLQTRKADTPWGYVPTSPRNWPLERVAAKPSAPLPRRRSRCFDDTTLARALAETVRTRSDAFLVWHDGAIEFERYGSGASDDTRVESASMAKSVLGLVVGQAIADGSIKDIDEPVSTWLNEWKDDPRGAITLRQMLNMSSGLEALPFDMAKGTKASLTQMGGDVLPVLLSLSLADPPGSVFNYGSTVSQLVGVIVERATGRRYADYLSTRLWQPIGAQEAWVSLDHPQGLAKTSGTLLARPEDWLRLGLLFLDGGRLGGRSIVASSWIDAMTAPSARNPNYGMQIWRASPYNPDRRYNVATRIGVPARAPFLAEDTVYFDGAGAQRVYISKRERLVVVRVGPAVFDWDDSLVPNAVTEAARACARSG